MGTTSSPSRRTTSWWAVGVGVAGWLAGCEQHQSPSTRRRSAPLPPQPLRLPPCPRHTARVRLHRGSTCRCLLCPLCHAALPTIASRPHALQEYGCNVVNLGNERIISVHMETARQIVQSPHFYGASVSRWFCLCGTVLLVLRWFTGSLACWLAGSLVHWYDRPSRAGRVHGRQAVRRACCATPPATVHLFPPRPPPPCCPLPACRRRAVHRLLPHHQHVRRGALLFTGGWAENHVRCCADGCCHTAAGGEKSHVRCALCFEIGNLSS